MVVTPACPVHIVGKRIVDNRGQTVYRDPGYRVVAGQVKCSGRTVWVLFHGGVASSQEAYLGVRSGDCGRTWKLLLSEPYFGVRAPFTIDSYSGRGRSWARTRRTSSAGAPHAALMELSR